MRAPAFLCPALSLAAALALTACGGEVAQPKAPVAVSPAPPELAALVVRIPSAKQDDALASGVRDALEAQLIRAGYKIAADGAPFDLDLDPQLSSQRLPSIFHVQVNGQDKYTMKVRLAVRVLGGGQVVDTLLHEFEQESTDPVAEADLAPLVERLTRSPRVGAFARAQAQKAEADARRMDDETTWKRADPARCRAEKTRAACVGVDTYVTMFPEGEHVVEAKDLLRRAK
jgi:hypothetical protein